MKSIPVIVGFGGINPAGRASSNHAYQRLVFDQLNKAKQRQTIASLSQLMGLQDASKEKALNHSLIRKIESQHMDSAKVLQHKRVKLKEKDRLIIDDKPLDVESVLVEDSYALAAQVAGQLPTGLDFKALYNSRNHPRGLQMSVFAMTDALGQLGMNWEALQKRVGVDRISVYMGSALSQLDEQSNGGLLKSRLMGKRTTSKHLAFGMADMPSAFANAYVLGHLGTAGNSQGACASFLYSLRHAVHDITSGRSRIAIAGSSEAPILPELIEGFSAMGALMTDQALQELDGGELNYHRACRPFGYNKGFVMAESAQCFVLMDAQLAIETGATIYGSVADVFVNADGYKKSIASPGAGNYITAAKSMAMAKAILGEKALNKGLLIAHGTGTSQNRVTESVILNRVAGDFLLQKMPVIAPKSQLGHSIASASADQLLVSLGIWNQGILPGIKTIDAIADDVHSEHLDFVLNDRNIDAEQLDYCMINAKGFGGNNASATILSPTQTRHLITKQQGLSSSQWSAYQQANESVLVEQQTYEDLCLSELPNLRYLYDHEVIADDAIHIKGSSLQLNGFEVSLDMDNPYC